MLTLIWSPSAFDQLEAISTYIAQFNESAAIALRHRIEDAVLPALSHPYAFRAGRIKGTREIVAHPNYIVVYRVAADHVEVLGVMHSHQEYP